MALLVLVCEGRTVETAEPVFGSSDPEIVAGVLRSVALRLGLPGIKDMPSEPTRAPGKRRKSH